jgi:hypothetical protein
LEVGLVVAVRYRIDPHRLSYMQSNLPQPLEKELVPPVVASSFRELAQNYLVRELFAARRGEIRREATSAVGRKVGAGRRDLQKGDAARHSTSSRVRQGLEGVLLKEQSTERLGVELDVKQKEVRAAELEAEAQKARDAKNAEAQAQVTVLQAKAQADAMQYTLQLKEKQIQQSRLEAEACKESTVKQAEAPAEVKVIDGKAELQKMQVHERGRSRPR